MGFDMYWVKKDPEEEKRVTAAREEFDRAISMQNAKAELTTDDEKAALQVLVKKSYESMMRAETSYYRLNIWGMGLCRDLMDERGMMAEVEPPPFPSQPEGMTEEEADEVSAALADCIVRSNEPITAIAKEFGLSSTATEFLVQMVRMLRGGEETPGIPWHKLGSNDGWVVTPIEIAGALSSLHDWAAEQLPDDDVVSEEDIWRVAITPPMVHEEYRSGTGDMVPVVWWPEWVAWLQKAVAHDGFRVH